MEPGRTQVGRTEEGQRTGSLKLVQPFFHEKGCLKDELKCDEQDRGDHWSMGSSSATAESSQGSSMAAWPGQEDHSYFIVDRMG